MNLPFFQKTSVKKKKESLDSNLELLYKREEDVLEPEEIDENFFYKHITTHFHPLFCESSIICVPHSKSIQGLVLTKDIIEAHCFQPSRCFRDQLVSTRQRQKTVLFDPPITIITHSGYKEKRTVRIMAEEMVYVGRKKIIVYSIDKLLEGEVPKKYSHKPAITIPPIRNAKNDLEFLNMFPENLEAIHELQLAVQEFIDTYVYIKGYNKTTVERIQHMYMKTYRTILQKNKLLQDSCRTPSEHDRFLELVENVVMSFLHKKIWIQTLQQLLESQDSYLDSICCVYSHVVLSQYSLRYPLSEMHVSCFYDAISNFQKIDMQAITPLEKLAVLRSTLDLISVAVRDYVKHFGHSTSDTSVTSDEMIPLLAFIIVQSRVPRKASLIYYMQHYRLARMIEGSVYSFVLATMKSACEFLKDDPLSLHDIAAMQRSRSVSFQHESKSSDLLLSHHRKTQSADFHKDTGPHILRPHIVLPSTNSSTSSHSDHRKSLEIPDHWVVYQSSSSSSTNTRHIQKQSLGASKPMFSTIVPSLSTNLYPTKLGRSLSASPTTTRKCPPEVIHVPERLDPIKRPASMIDTVSDDDMGDFLNSLSLLDGDVVGERTGSIKSLNYIPL